MSKSKQKFEPCYVDFEFNGVVEPKVNLVCATTRSSGVTNDWDLHKNFKGKNSLAKYLENKKLIIGYSCVAEARSFIALGLDPLDFEWIDLFYEYRMLTNHNDKLQWGKQLVDGKVRPTRKPKPKWERTEEDKATGFKATHSLAEATYKLTGEIRDTVHKTEMRDLIISAPEHFRANDFKAIQAYCREDVKFLPKIWARIQEEFLKLRPDADIKEYIREAKKRGRYAAHTAWMETKGYPIDVEKTRNFSNQVGTIVFDMQREINGFFPDVKPFKWNRKEQRFSENQKAIKGWIEENHDTKRWMKTDSGGISLKLDAWEQHYTFKHDYPTNNFGAQMLRYLKLKQSIYGFSQTKNKKNKNFWDSVGSDGIVRPYLNPFAAQSSRSQPGASGFLFLKPAWMRALCIPPKGYFMAYCDWSSQEFLISALKSQDQNMIDAYLSGDPYFYQAKLSRAVPWNAKRKDYEATRDLFKATTLGISYLMSKYGLAAKLTADTGREWTEDEAQEQIDLFYENFEDLKFYQDELQDQYQDDGFIKLEDGWYMWGDNDNHRSVGNVPIQGLGAVAMRESVDLGAARGVDIRFTLHDALTMYGKVGRDEEKILTLMEAMKEGFASQFEGKMKKFAKQIRVDAFAWSRNYEANSKLNVKGIEIPCSNLYADKRALSDLEKFSQYFNTRPEDVGL